MKVSTNLKSGPNGAGLCEGDVLEIVADEECVYIAFEVMTEYMFMWHTFKGSPIVIQQQDYTTQAQVKLQRFNMSLVGKHLLKAVLYGVDNQQNELDVEFYIYPKGTVLT